MDKHQCKCNRKFGTQENDRMIRIDQEARKKAETLMGATMTDNEWFFYKL